MHDPQVQDAADHAVKTIQQRSNSLFPYELHEIVHAKAEASTLSLISLCIPIRLGVASVPQYQSISLA